MKKYLSCVAFCTIIAISFGQTQRTELIEEFTGENCDPCAGVNPWLTKLILKNQSPKRKVILLRHQCTPAPSHGSLYSDNPEEVEARAVYYNISGVPHACIDGDDVPPDGHASSVNQQLIDQRYLVNSPFGIEVSHKVNTIGDSIYVSIKIQAFQNYSSAASLKLRCAITEEFIHFDTPPGTNGEKDFEFVMRKMIPDENGLKLNSNTWITGQTQTFTMKAEIPDYIKNKPLMAIVAFIQDDGNKIVLNSAYSEPVPFPALDISLNALSSGIIGCVSSFSPVIELKNSGMSLITSAIIDYTLDNGTANTFINRLVI